MSTNKDSIPWSEWRVKAQKSYVKGKYTAQNMIHDWGYPSDWDVEKNRIIFRKGVPGAYGRETRKSNRKKFNSKRSLLSNVSTVDADTEGKNLEALHKILRDESSLFKLSDPDIDELFTEHGISLNTYDNFDFQGASNDPDNRYINGKNNSLLKNEAEEYLKNNNLDKDFVIFNDVEGGDRIESARKYDRVVDNFNQGQIFTSINDVESFVNNTSTAKPGLLSIQDVLASATKRAGEKIVRNAVPYAGTALDYLDTKQRFDEFKQDPNLINGAQLAVQGISSAANGVSDVLLSTGIGAPVALGAEKVSGLMSITDAVLQGVEDLNPSAPTIDLQPKQIRGRSGSQRAQKDSLE